MIYRGLNKHINVKDTPDIPRLLKVINSDKEGPVIVFFAGIHGNEPAGLKALKQVFNELDPREMIGSLYAIAGNLQALEQNKRYIDHDLNRMWTPVRMQKRSFENEIYREDIEQLEILSLLNQILHTHKTPIYFIDLHTTSSQSLPFITINDSLINRRFSRLFPVPVILGIEEYLEGPLLSYINELGYVSLGFESGQHQSKKAVINAVAFIKLAIHYAGLIKLERPNKELKFLSKGANLDHHFYEIFSRYSILKNEKFRMRPGFSSFQYLKKGTLLANSEEKGVYLSKNAMIFMPLYQQKGEHGYYLIRKIKPVFLKLSSICRRFRLDGLLTFFPGVKWFNQERSSLYIDLRIARFFVKPLFHLLGYRSREIGPYFLKVSSRDRRSKTELYNNLDWYKKTLSN